jgi:hypothetical protein
MDENQGPKRPSDEEKPPRVTRPEPSRTSPFRSWGTLFGLAAGAPPPHDGHAGASDETRDAASLGDVVSRSVELGYRVVDDYLRQGERAASRLGGGERLGPALLAGEAQDFAGRMTRYASDFLGLWLEFLEIAATGRGAAMPMPPPTSNGHPAPPDAPVPPPATPGAASPAAPAERVRVRVEVVSARPAEVSLELRPDLDALALVVHALRAVDPEKPRIDDVTLRRDGAEGPLTLRIRVPEGHPAGVYNGLIIETATSRPVGTVSVRLEAIA